MNTDKYGNCDECITLSETKAVVKQGNVVLRPAGPWTPNIHALLRHLREAGISWAPTIVGNGYHKDGRETLSYLEGELVHPLAWSDQAIVEVGRMLRQLHDAAANFVPPKAGVWKPWFLRDLGRGGLVISHGDVAPWNMLTKDGMPLALIDWEYAGPVDPLIELARVCWLFPQLHGDDVAERWNLPSADSRVRQVRLLVDAYGLSQDQREGMLDRIVEVVVNETAWEAVEADVTPDSVGPLWGFAWRARAGAWILRQRRLLQRALM